MSNDGEPPVGGDDAAVPPRERRRVRPVILTHVAASYLSFAAVYYAVHQGSEPTAPVGVADVLGFVVAPVLVPCFVVVGPALAVSGYKPLHSLYYVLALGYLVPVVAITLVRRARRARPR